MTCHTEQRWTCISLRAAKKPRNSATETTEALSDLCVSFCGHREHGAESPIHQGVRAMSRRPRRPQSFALRQRRSRNQIQILRFAALRSE